MNRRELKRKAARTCIKERSVEFREIPKEEWPKSDLPGLTRVYRNNLYVVLIFDGTKDLSGDAAVKIMVKHNFNKAVGWKELQFIKNGIFGPEVCAYQYLPPESLLVDAVNMYWFFIKQEEIDAKAKTVL